MSWHGTIVILEWLLFTAGVYVLVRRIGWGVGAALMAGSLLFQAAGGLVSFVAIEKINQHQAYWILMLAWTISTLVFAGGFLLACFELRRPNQ